MCKPVVMADEDFLLRGVRYESLTDVAWIYKRKVEGYGIEEEERETENPTGFARRRSGQDIRMIS